MGAVITNQQNAIVTNLVKTASTNRHFSPKPPVKPVEFRQFTQNNLTSFSAISTTKI